MNKTVLIIGGTSGLGRELAKQYCEENATVGIIGRRENLLEEFTDSYPKNAKACKADINSNNFNEIFLQFVQELGHIDIIVFTASIIHFNHHLDLEKEFDTINTNVVGYTRAVNLAYHYFKKVGRGHIVIVTSVAKARGNKLTPAYNASKAYQASYSDALKMKLKAEGGSIILTEIVPGYIETGMAKGDRIFWMSSVEKAARLTKKAIEKKRATVFITPRWWFVYQLQRLIPRFLYHRLANSSLTLKKKA
ncbi:MAG: oxidoreductase [Chitinophagaceae bacterium]